MKLKVGLDLDGVVYDFITPFDRFAESRGYLIDRTKYDRGINRKSLEKLFDVFFKSKPYEWIPIYKNNLELFRRLGEKLFDYYIVTHRDHYDNSKEQTIARLKHDGIIYKDIYFSKDKFLYAKSLDLDLFFEDSLENAIKIVQNSDTKVLLMDKEYNQGELQEGIIRLKDNSIGGLVK